MQNEFGQNVTLYLTIFHDLVFKQCFFFSCDVAEDEKLYIFFSNNRNINFLSSP